MSIARKIIHQSAEVNCLEEEKKVCIGKIQNLMRKNALLWKKAKNLIILSYLYRTSVKPSFFDIKFVLQESSEADFENKIEHLRSMGGGGTQTVHPLKKQLPFICVSSLITARTMQNYLWNSKNQELTIISLHFLRLSRKHSAKGWRLWKTKKTLNGRCKNMHQHAGEHAKPCTCWCLVRGAFQKNS